MRSPSTQLRVRLTPRADATRIVRRDQDVLHVRVSAPPVDGAANRALLDLLAKSLDTPRNNISIRSGASAREKVFEIEGMTSEELWQRVERVLERS